MATQTHRYPLFIASVLLTDDGKSIMDRVWTHTSAGLRDFADTTEKFLKTMNMHPSMDLHARAEMTVEYTKMISKLVYDDYGTVYLRHGAEPRIQRHRSRVSSSSKSKCECRYKCKSKEVCPTWPKCRCKCKCKSKEMCSSWK
jgi:hypothetical protein